jgi:extracellular elastinolytic metalloproteinase
MTKVHIWTRKNVAASYANAFYIINSIHDVTYRYGPGFTEEAFNLQQSNNNKGGTDNDRVTISIQDVARVDNADFSTPPESIVGSQRIVFCTSAANQDIVECTSGIAPTLNVMVL